MRARPLRGLSESQRQTLSLRFSQTLRAWATEWIVGDAALELRACVACEASQAAEWIGAASWTWRRWASPDEADHGDPAVCWLAEPTDLAHRIGCNSGLMSESHGNDADSIGGRVSARAVADLHARIGGMLGLSPDVADAPPPPIAEASRPFSGAALLCIELAGIPLIVLANGALVGRICPPPRMAKEAGDALIDPLRAVAPLKTRVECRLRPLTVDFGALVSLEPDDVLVLDQLLHEPLYLDAADETPLCRAFLGKRGASLVIELVPDNQQAIH